MKGSTLILVILAHLISISASFIIIEEEDDAKTTNENEGDSMVPYVYRPRYSSSALPGKRNIGKEISEEEYKELREESNLGDDYESEDEKDQNKRYFLIHESALDTSTGDEEENKKQLGFGYMRRGHRLSGNEKWAQNLHSHRSHYQQRPRFYMQGKKEVRPRFKGDGYGKVNKKEVRPRFQGDGYGKVNKKEVRPRFQGDSYAKINKKEVRPRFQGDTYDRNFKKEVKPRFMGNSYGRINKKRTLKVIVLKKQHK